MTAFRIPAHLILPERSSRRTALRNVAGLGLGLGAATMAGSAFAQHDMGTATPGATDNDYVTGGTGDATPGPGEPTPFTRYNPYLDPVEPGDKEVTISARDVTVEVASGKLYAGWSFNGSIPGAPLRGVVGDTIHVVVKNDAPLTHSVDFHAAQVAANEGYKNVLPGESFEWDMELTYPGAYMVHCGTPPVLMHIATGMYLPMVVDPAAGEGFEPAAREIILSQSEFYLMDQGDGTFVTDTDNLFTNNTAPTHVVFNGHANQYIDEPIEVPVGELVRIYLVNHGPNVWSAFHIVGAIFHKAYLNANPKNVFEGLQTITVAPGDGVCVETIFPMAGDYVAVNHSFGYAQSGAMAKFIAS